MADPQKITQLNSKASLSPGDLFVVVEDPDGAAETKKISAQAVLQSALAGIRVIGPFIVDYDDIPGFGDHVDLFTPAIGDLILDWWPDPDTFIQFSDGGELSYAVSIGQSDAFIAAQPAGQADRPPGLMGYPGASDFELDNSGPEDATINQVIGQAMFKDNGDYAGTRLKVVRDANAVRAYNALGFNGSSFNLTMIAGHVEIYFLVATPVAP